MTSKVRSIRSGIAQAIRSPSGPGRVWTTSGCGAGLEVFVAVMMAAWQGQGSGEQACEANDDNTHFEKIV